MYGPPPDPRQTLAPVQLAEDPTAYALCIFIGAVLSGLAFIKRWPQQARALLLIAGQVIALTAPLAYHLDRYVYGAFPTIDKAGSIGYYLQGVHLNALDDPFDPAVRLIGVHLGHHWISAVFDLFLSPYGAFNAQGLMYIILGWWAAWLLLREVSQTPRLAMVMAFPYGMGLHIFRDLNWYTIEKAAIFWIPLYAWTLFKAHRGGGRWRWRAAIVFLAMSFTNLYLGLVCALLATLAVLWLAADALHKRTITKGLQDVFVAAAASAIAISPLIVWQFALMSGAKQIGTPEDFLWKRAALDSFTLIPLRWNRLEIHRALNLIGLGLAAIGAVQQRKDRRVQFAALTAGIFFLFSLGPWLITDTIKNPVYMTAWMVIPAFWRIAKPETFFHVSWMMLLGIATVQLKEILKDRRGIAGLALYALFVLAWIVMVRSHPVYPTMTLKKDVSIAPQATERAFQQ